MAKKAENKIDNSKDERLNVVYTDAKNRKWYGFVNPIAELPPARGIAGSRAERYVGLMINEKELELCLDEQIKAFNSMDIVKAASIAQDLKHRRKFLTEEKSTLDLAGVYYLLEDEDPDTYSEITMEKKRAIWEDDEKCRGFFLHMAFNLTKKFPNMSEQDLLKFMDQTRTIANRIYEHIKTPIQRSSNM